MECSGSFYSLDRLDSRRDVGMTYDLKKNIDGNFETIAIAGIFNIDKKYYLEVISDEETLIYKNLDLLEQMRKVYDYTELNGGYRVIQYFDYFGKNKEFSKTLEIFCKMYFLIMSSFENCNSEYPECGDGYYDDVLSFSAVLSLRGFQPSFSYKPFHEKFRASELM
jgi:hypothetical protein